MAKKEWITDRKFFRRDEFLVSSSYPDIAKGQDVSEYDWDIVKLGVESVLDPLREKLRSPVVITSGIRFPQLNALVRGAKDSDHIYSCAADILVRSLTSHQLAIRLLELNLPYRQVVAYSNKPHVHVSWNIPGRPYKQDVILKS